MEAIVKALLPCLSKSQRFAVQAHPGQESRGVGSRLRDLRLFAACLNWADFASDWLVVLQYGCIIGGSLPRGSRCHAEGFGGCQAHGWWFGIGLSLLVISTVFQSWLWTINSYDYLKNHKRLPSSTSGTAILMLCLFLLGLCQLHYLLDIVLALIHQDTPKENHYLRDMIFWRELMVKAVESAPQLYFQLYVLLALEGHENAWRVISVVVSAVALGYGLVDLLNYMDKYAVKEAAWLHFSLELMSFEAFCGIPARL